MTKIISVNLSVDSISKLDSIAGQIGRSRSTTLERVIMAIPDRSLIRYARKNPVYAVEGVADDGNETGVQQTTTRG